MKEIVKSSEPNYLVRSLSKLLEPCGYQPDPNHEKGAHFFRLLNPPCRWPSYQLGVGIKEGKFKVFFQLNKKPYEDVYHSPEVSCELQRVMEVLETQSDGHRLKKDLLIAVNHRLIFGMGELIERYRQTFGKYMGRRILARKKKARVRKEAKSRFLKMKYEDLEERNY